MSISNREKLLQAGIELLSEKTFSEISMDQVAESSGVSKPMIYYYFNNKEGYYKALAGHLLQIARSLNKKILRPDLSLRENMTNYVRFRIEYVKTNPGISRAFMSMFTDPNIGLLIEEMQDEINVMRMEFIDPMFDRAKRNGEILPDTNGIMVIMTLNSFIIAITIKILNRIPIHDKINIEEIVDILFNGISARREDN
ncbi:MAG: TetR/AcrR family transcriptional regulator [Candidatus Aegiribacteria sp.]|nr:TetR/AcrR family transcriptional regulator [Candidatus Aegiribacteria sp.]